MSTLHVRVTQDDIDLATVRRAYGTATTSSLKGLCPVEIALNRLGFPDAVVGSPHVSERIWLNLTNLRSVPEPPAVQAAVAQWDETHTMTPFEFDLTLPEETK